MRICRQCQEVMLEGYCIGEGLEYYCSDECLHHHYDEATFQALYVDGGDCYWSTWEIEDADVLPEQELINAIQRTLLRCRPHDLPTDRNLTLSAWIQLYCEIFAD